MADSPAPAIRDLIVADIDITAQLATYDFGGPAVTPAVFTTDPIPVDAELPAIVITEIGGDNDFGSRSHKGAHVRCDVRVYDDKDRSRQAVRILAWALWRLLHRAHLDIECMSDIGCYADPPAEITDAEGFPGFVIPVLIWILDEVVA